MFWVYYAAIFEKKKYKFKVLIQTRLFKVDSTQRHSYDWSISFTSNALLVSNVISCSFLTFNKSSGFFKTAFLR